MKIKNIWNHHPDNTTNLYNPPNCTRCFPSQSCDLDTWTLGHETEHTDRSHWIDSFRDGLVREKTTIAYNPWRIHGTGIFTYMNGWFLWWYPHVKYIPLPLISISKNHSVEMTHSSTPSYANVSSGFPTIIGNITHPMCLAVAKFLDQTSTHNGVAQCTPWWKQHLGQGKQLVGGWTNPLEKYARQIGNFPPS